MRSRVQADPVTAILASNTPALQKTRGRDRVTQINRHRVSDDVVHPLCADSPVLRAAIACKPGTQPLDLLVGVPGRDRNADARRKLIVDADLSLSLCGHVLNL